MQISSLARQTDLFFARFEGEVRDHGEYISVRTPSNPGYHWGNYLLFANPPGPGDHERWPAIYRQEFDYYPEIRHMTFSWDPDVPGLVEPFVQAGFRLERLVVLTAGRVVPPVRLRTDLEIRALQSDADWEQAIATQIHSRDPSFPASPYEAFKRSQFKMYRSMSEQGLGNWFGAFDGPELLGDLGIFHQQGLGRFQNVETAPEFRRQGICGTLVYETARRALRDWPVQRLVMEADADYHAAAIYESVGFRPAETNYSLSWWQPNPA